MSKLDEKGLELTADVLVIGGGPAAAWATIAAAESGAKVVVADKGYLGTSGAFAASTSGAKVVPPLAELRDPVKFERYALGGFLSQHSWWERVLDVTYENAPKIYDWAGYEKPAFNGKTGNGYGYGPGGGLQGSETMRIMRKKIVELGVKILDQSPAFELLVDEDGAVAGARGLNRQTNTSWTVRAGATVLASGGCAWLSKALGCDNNTGDGLLMTVEAGGELSSMEFSAHYSPAPAHASITKSAFYRYATYSDKDGNPLQGLSKNGHRSTSAIAKVMLREPVYCKLDQGGVDNPDQQKLLRIAQPNFFAAFDKVGVNPFEERFEIKLLLEGTVRGVGGIRVVNEDCGTTVSGLYAAGDAASRELICGGFTGGAGPNMTWVIGSGNLSGKAAAKFAKKLGDKAATRPVKPAGQAGLVAKEKTEQPYDARAVIKAVQDEVFPYDKNIFRTEEGLLRSLAKLETLWKEVQKTPAQGTAQEFQKSREAASLVAAARWSYFAGLERKETRGMHKRLDYPAQDPNQRHYLAVGGLDTLWTRAEEVPEEVVPEPAHLKEAVHA